MKRLDFEYPQNIDRRPKKDEPDEDLMEESPVTSQIDKGVKSIRSAMYVASGDAFHVGGVYKNAIDCYEAARRLDLLQGFENIELDLKLAESYLMLGNRYLYKGVKKNDFDAAEFYFKKALEYMGANSAPFKADIYCGLGQLSYDRKEYAGAELHYKDALEINDKHVLSLVGTAYVYLTQNEKIKAEEHFKKAYRANPKSREAAYGMAYLNYQNGKHNRASQYLNSLLQNFPDDVEALMFLGEIACERRNIIEAERIYKRVLAVDSNCEEALKALHVVREWRAGLVDKWIENAYVEGAQSVAEKKLLN